VPAARRRRGVAAQQALHLALGYTPTGATKNGESVMEKRLFPVG